MKLPVTLAVLVTLAVPAKTDASKYPGGCNTRACLKRTCKAACQERVRAKAVRRHRLRVIAPYRGWLRSLRACESPAGRDSADGRYHGFYQFSLTTWASVGGHGDPHEATWLEQSYRAVLLRIRIGNPHQAAGWPVCG